MEPAGTVRPVRRDVRPPACAVVLRGRGGRCGRVARRPLEHDTTGDTAAAFARRVGHQIIGALVDDQGAAVVIRQRGLAGFQREAVGMDREQTRPVLADRDVAEVPGVGHRDLGRGRRGHPLRGSHHVLFAGGRAAEQGVRRIDVAARGVERGVASGIAGAGPVNVDAVVPGANPWICTSMSTIPPADSGANAATPTSCPAASRIGPSSPSPTATGVASCAAVIARPKPITTAPSAAASILFVRSPTVSLPMRKGAHDRSAPRYHVARRCARVAPTRHANGREPSPVKRRHTFTRGRVHRRGVIAGRRCRPSACPGATFGGIAGSRFVPPERRIGTAHLSPAARRRGSLSARYPGRQRSGIRGRERP